MIISGKIMNALNTLPIEGAVISVYRKNGSSQQLGNTDAAGNYNVNAPDSVQCLLIQKPGFTPTLTDPGTLQAAPTFEINPAVGPNPVPQIAQLSTGTPGMSAGGAAVAVNSPVNYVPLTIAGLTALLLAGAGKGKKIGSVDYTMLIILAAVGVGAYFLFSNIGSLFGGSAANTANNNAITANTTAAQAADLANSTKTVPPTLSVSNAASIANDIYAQANTYSFITGISTAAQLQILFDINQIENISDYYLVAQSFGTKNMNCSPLGGCTAMDLPTAVKFVLTQDQIAEINNNFADSGINFSF
jgi:hypothetical protein